MEVQKDKVKGVIKNIQKIFKYISNQRKRQLSGLALLAILGAGAEAVSIGAIIPFISVLTNPRKIEESQSLLENIGLSGMSTEHITIGITTVFIFAVFVAGIVRIGLLYTTIKIGNGIGADLNIEIFKKTLLQPYEVHINRNSSQIISGVVQKTSVATDTVISVVTISTMVILFITITLTLLFFESLLSGVSIVGIGVVYGSIAWWTKRKLSDNSHTIATNQTSVIKSIQEGLGSIRDLILSGNQEGYSGKYKRSIHLMCKANIQNTFLNQSPRYAIEMIALVILSMIVLVMSNEMKDPVEMLPSLGIIALGAQRLLPLIQQLYGNWNVLMGTRSSLADVIELLDQPTDFFVKREKNVSLKWRRSIRFSNVSFSYASKSDCDPVLQNINLEIKCGDKVGIVGKTGSGKSTFLDLVMCLLVPSTGKILIDGIPLDKNNTRSWQRNVANVPQTIYLNDESIMKNIAFNLADEEIDYEKIRYAATKAGINDFINTLPEKYSTIIGERGARLSGGQRQRLAIARAFYKESNVLILDEATSALDNETELTIMETISALGSDVTTLIVAHRHTTLENCDYIIKIEKNSVLGPFQLAELLK